MDTLKSIIENLSQEAVQIQIQGRALRPDEIARVQAIYQAIPHLRQALAILSTEMDAGLITYKIVSDVQGRLKQAARTACNFWNRFVVPSGSIVIRLNIFSSNSQTIARAYKPYKKDSVVYGIVEFNTKYLSTFSAHEIAGTVTHEIGHTLGFGWKAWLDLFDDKGIFSAAAVRAVEALNEMRVETDFGPGTKYAHWDETRHDEELMTGFKDKSEYVLPVTIDIMTLLGHQVIETLPKKTELNPLLDGLAQIVFSRQAEAKAIDRDHFEKTDLWEKVPHNQPLSKKGR